MEGCYGEVKDLFQFANLAKVNWTKAVSLFKSSDFEKILLKKEQEKKLLYQGLLKGTNKEQALEEFLVSIQKKEIPILAFVHFIMKSHHRFPLAVISRCIIVLAVVLEAMYLHL